MSAYKVLGQVSPAASSLTDLYATPVATQAFCSTLSVCNRGTTTSYIRIAVCPAAIATDNKHYIVYDTLMIPQDSLFLTIGISLGATDVVRVNATTSSVSFSLFGSEI